MERSQYQYVVDRRLYSDEVVARAAHRHTGRCAVEMRIEGHTAVVFFSGISGTSLPLDLPACFTRDLLDERLRASVRAETAGLQQELIRAALAQAQLPMAPDVPV